jgi:ASC-1-like (ASCH) protein
MSKRKATEEGVKKAAEQILQGESELKQYLTQIEQLAQKIGVEPRQLLLRVIETGVRVYDWGSMTIPQLIVCVDFLSYLDERFYKRIYVESPIDAVIRQADKFSEATRKILEGYGAMIRVKTPQQQQEEEEEEAKPKQQQQQGGVLDRMIDHVVTYIADELGARLSNDIVDAVEPQLKEVLINMIKEGKIRIEITGEELVKSKEEAAAAKQ